MHGQQSDIKAGIEAVKQMFSDWEPVMREAHQSRYALMQVSERKWAVLQRCEGFQALGNDRIGVNQYEIRDGCGKLSYFDAQEEFLKLRRAERVYHQQG